jgi:uncharacterized lipoprotein YmbA
MRKWSGWLGPTLVGLTLLAGCLGLGERTPPTRFFVLVATVPASGGLEGAATGAVVVVERPLLPAYLNRPQLVSYRAPGEVAIAPFSRWAEPLDTGIARVVAENLQRLWPAARVVAGEVPPGVASPLRLRLRVQRFEGGPDPAVQLEGFWSLAAADEQVVSSGAIHAKAPWHGDDDALAAALSTLLADAARTIAAAGEPGP